MTLPTIALKLTLYEMSLTNLNFRKQFALTHVFFYFKTEEKCRAQRKQTLEEKKACVPFSSILSDKSIGKVTSHHGLIAYIEKFGEAAFIKVYQKPQLHKMCEAYDVKCSVRQSKKKMAQALVPVMKSCERVPYPYHLAILQPHLTIDDDNHSITMRFSMQST